MTQHDCAVSLPRLGFKLFDLEENSVVGYLHRQTERNFYYYPILKTWECKTKKDTEERIKKRPSLITLYPKFTNRGFYAFHNNAQSSKYGFRLETTKIRKTLTIIERLELALGKDQFILSSVGPTKVNHGFQSVVCRKSTDALLASLIINQC